MDCSSDKLDPAAKVLNHLAQVQMSRKQARAQEQLSAITSRIESVSLKITITNSLLVIYCDCKSLFTQI